MVGCIYKIIAKTLVARLKTVMPGLISETQTTFISERQILDGALIANEVVHWLKKEKKMGVLIKLDFQKAYDSVRWSFVDKILQKMGFGMKWREWIK